MKKFLNEDGATSVLIVFMMIVLVTLGAFAITSANVNIKFSKKSINWMKNYYSLDAKAESILADIDSELAKAESEAVRYMQLMKFAENDNDIISSDVHNANVLLWTEGTGTKDDILDQIYRNAYLWLAFENLRETVGLPVSANVEAEKDGLIVTNVIFTQNFVSELVENNGFVDEGTKDYNLSVKIEANADTMSFSYENNSVVMEQKHDELRFIIMDWLQWHTPKDYDSGQPIWDGSIF